jgi:hypothetical protein
MGSCSAGCIADFLCDGGPSLPVDATTLAPYVRLTIDGAVNITVGNESDPENQNTAVIKSFQFGTSNGAGTSIEIFDEQGGDFERCMDKLNKCITSTNRDYRMHVDFGWINGECDGSGGFKKITTDKFYFIPLSIEANYTEGKIKFIITGSSLLEPVFESRANKTYPKMSLKAAIKELMQECYPKISSVKYKRVGSDKEWDFKDFPDGPERPWQSENQNKLATAMDWIKPYRTDADKGIRATWNEKVAGGEVIFWEDPEENPNESSIGCLHSLGSYIVNGGACSPVISFTPQAKWVYGALHANSGGVGGAVTSKTTPNTPKPGMEKATDACSGIQNTNTTDNGNRDTLGARAPEEMNKSAVAHDKANKRLYPMEAELRIQGDPNLAGIEKTFGTTVSIIVINPFHLSGDGCGDWLAQPGCNPVYSNKAWWIKGIDHSIKEGSYVTTLKLVLAAPGSDIGPDEVFGGQGSGGWQPPTPCST